MTGPRHTHDCAACVFVGRTGRYDLYACPDKRGTTYVARYGPDGPDYLSAPEPISSIKWPLSAAVAHWRPIAREAL